MSIATGKSGLAAGGEGRAQTQIVTALGVFGGLFFLSICVVDFVLYMRREDR